MVSYPPGPLDYIYGVNYGNTFIPEDFFADNDFFVRNGVSKVQGKYSLCDLGGDKEKAMRNWLDSQIKEQDF